MHQAKRNTLLIVLFVLVFAAVFVLEAGQSKRDSGGAIIHQKLVALLETHGVRSFDSVGKPFTPDLHDAVAVTGCANVEPGTVIEVLRQGYLWKDELFRPAQVQVSE